MTERQKSEKDEIEDVFPPAGGARVFSTGSADEEFGAAASAPGVSVFSPVNVQMFFFSLSLFIY